MAQPTTNFGTNREQDNLSKNIHTMEHRTLRQNHGFNNNNNNLDYFTNKSLECSKPKLKSGSTIFQSTFQSFDNLASTINKDIHDKRNENQLPSPAKIMPFSGIKPHVSF